MDTFTNSQSDIDTIVIKLINELSTAQYESSFNNTINKLILTLILSGKTLFDIKNPLSNVIGYRLVNDDGTLSDKIHNYEGAYFTKAELTDYITKYKSKLIKADPDTVLNGNDLTEEQLSSIFTTDERYSSNRQSVNNNYVTLPVAEIFGRLNTLLETENDEEHYLIDMFAELLNLTEEQVSKEIVTVYDNNLVIDYNIDFNKLNLGTHQTVIEFATSLPTAFSSSNNTFTSIETSMRGFTSDYKQKELMLYNEIANLFKRGSYYFKENERRIINEYNKLEHYPAIIKILNTSLPDFCRFSKYTFNYGDILNNIDDIVNYIKTHNISVTGINVLSIISEETIPAKLSETEMQLFIDNLNIIKYLLDDNVDTYSIQIIEGFDINMLSQTNITNLKLTGSMPFSFNNYIINIPSLEKLVVGTMTHIELSPDMINLKSLSVNTVDKLSNTVEAEYYTLLNPSLGKLPPNIEELELYYIQSIDVIPEDILKHFNTLRNIYVCNLEFDYLDDDINANGVLINFWDTPTIINMYFDDCFSIIPDKYKKVANKALKRIKKHNNGSLNEAMAKNAQNRKFQAMLADIAAI